MPSVKNEVGNKYGMLTVIGRYGKCKLGATWLCECDCGNTCAAVGVRLRNGTVRSCGCLREMPFKERAESGLAPHGQDRWIADGA